MNFAFEHHLLNRKMSFYVMLVCVLQTFLTVFIIEYKALLLGFCYCIEALVVIFCLIWDVLLRFHANLVAHEYVAVLFLISIRLWRFYTICTESQSVKHSLATLQFVRFERDQMYREIQALNVKCENLKVP